MCLILFSYKSHPKYKLVVAANRDEFYVRATQPAHFWEEDARVLAGKDLEAGGTWMGVAKTGRLSMLTNFRDPHNIKANAPSRGQLVLDYLKGSVNGGEYLEKIAKNGGAYNGFNLVTGTFDDLHYYGNYQNRVLKIPPGIHGLSNALLNTDWPKTVKGKSKLAQMMKNSDLPPEQLFDILYDDIKAPDRELPNTGVSKEKESMLSPMFIKSPDYGSRCSTVIMVDHDNHVQFLERTYDTTTFEFFDKTFEFDAVRQDAKSSSTEIRHRNE